MKVRLPIMPLMKARFAKGVMLLTLVAAVVAPAVAMADHQAPDADFQSSGCVDSEAVYFRSSMTVARQIGGGGSGNFAMINYSRTQFFQLNYAFGDGAGPPTVTVEPSVGSYFPQTWVTGLIEYTFSANLIFSDDVNDYYFIVFEGQVDHSDSPYAVGSAIYASGYFASGDNPVVFLEQSVITSSCPLPAPPTPPSAPSTTVPPTTVPPTTVPPTTVPPTTVPPTTVPPTTVPPTTVPPTTTIPIDVGDTGETLPETGSSEDVESAVPLGLALLLIGLTLVAAGREVRVSWKT